MNTKTTTYVSLIHSAITAYATKPCLTIKRNGHYQTWNFKHFGDEVNALAQALQAQKFGKHCNAILIGENCPEWVIIYHAIVLCGGCVVPIDPNLPGDEMKEIILQTKPMFIFSSKLFFHFMQSCLISNPSVRQIISFDAFSEESTDLIAFTKKKKTHEVNLWERDCTADDPVAILFTSGTTGKAKGTVLVQKNYTAIFCFGVPRMHLNSNDVMIAVLPLHHVFGFGTSCAAAIPTGIETVYIPVIKGPLIIEAFADRGITIFPAVPQILELMYENIMRTVKSKGAPVQAVFASLGFLSTTLGSAVGTHFKRQLFSSVHATFGGKLRLIVSGGSSLKKRYFDGYRKMGFDIVEGYGLTETCGPITICPLEDPRAGSIGPVFGENELCIVNKNEEGIGELCFKGTSVFSGYFNNNAATQAVFDAQGWFHTGDLGIISSDGFISITGRSKDLIVLNSGKNVYPDELEEFFGQCDSIEELAVFGLREDGEETVAAIIVPNRTIRRKYPTSGAAAIIKEEIEILSKNLPTYKKIARFKISYTSLPRTTTKKIKKNDLPAIFASLDSACTDSNLVSTKLSYLETLIMESNEFKVLHNYISSISNKINTLLVTPKSRLETDLMLDSLKALDLICMVEKEFSISLPLSDYMKFDTLGDLIGYILDRKFRPQSLSLQRESKVLQGTSPKPPNRPESQAKPSWYFVPMIRTQAALSNALWHPRHFGVHYIPSGGPLIFAANHQSILDIPFILGALSNDVLIDTYIIGKKELTEIPFLGRIFSGSNIIAVDRFGDTSSALSRIQDVLKSKKNILLFPEGTRTKTGEIGPFRSGLGILMRDIPCSVIPIRIRGSFEAIIGKYPSGSRATKAKSSPTISFGQPITVSNLLRGKRISTQYTADDLNDAVRTILLTM